MDESDRRNETRRREEKGKGGGKTVKRVGVNRRERKEKKVKGKEKGKERGGRQETKKEDRGGRENEKGGRGSAKGHGRQKKKEQGVEKMIIGLTLVVMCCYVTLCYRYRRLRMEERKDKK